ELGDVTVVVGLHVLREDRLTPGRAGNGDGAGGVGWVDATRDSHGLPGGHRRRRHRDHGLVRVEDGDLRFGGVGAVGDADSHYAGRCTGRVGVEIGRAAGREGEEIW